MRQKNWRFVMAGTLLLVLAIGFFLVMMGMAPKSTDPRGMMETVGQVSGVCAGISVVLILAGLIGRRVQN